jgi:hypothetical protein
VGSLTDYKMVRLSHRANGTWKVMLRIYEGDITTEDEEVGDEVVAITRYRRTAKLEDRTLTIPAMTEAAVRIHLNESLDGWRGGRTAIEEQRVA